MWDEFMLAWRMTPKAAFRFKFRREESWISDKHLLTGFLLGAPVFIASVLYAQRKMQAGVPEFLTTLAGAIAANVLWLTYSAWSRERNQIETRQ